MEMLVRYCPCGQQAANRRGVPRCEACRLANGRDHQRECKRRDQQRALVKAGLAPGSIVTATCSWCSEPFQFASLGHRRTKCDQCKKKSGSALRAEWQRRNPEKHRSAKQRHLKSALGAATTRAYNVGRGRFNKYRVDRDWYEQTLSSQQGRCAICRTADPGGRHGAWHIDHDRSCCPASRSCGPCVRGLLCDQCNLGLGKFADDPDRLRSAASYLDRFRRESNADDDAVHPAPEEENRG